MKKILYTTLIVFGLVLMACPYESKVALNTYEQSLKIDKKLIDIWVCFNEDGGRNELSIEKASKNVLTIKIKDYDKSNKVIDTYKCRAFATQVGDDGIFNLESDEGEYIFAKYAWTSKNEFYIQLIKDDFMKTNFKEDTVTTKNLRTFITENVNKSELFDEKLEFYRKYSPEYEMVRTYMRKNGF